MNSREIESDQFEDVEKSKNSKVAMPVQPILVFLVATLATAVILELLNDTSIIRKNPSTPTYAIYGKSPTEDHLVHVLNVLDRFGYQRVPFDDGNKWDLLWAHDYPYLEMPERMKNLKDHQVVNHWPGCGFITNKVDLCTTRLSFLPPAFRLPQQRQEFFQYARVHPNALFVEKHNEHRHIQIRAPHEVNLSSSDTFVQVFVPNPFLVDGHKFDVGVYVLITSIDPLRVYMYTGDVLFRYCPVEYQPFDSTNVDKYVVGDDYLPTWDVPSLKRYYEHFGGSMRASFEAYVKSQGLDSAPIWVQVEQIVRETILSKEQDIVRILRAYKTRNFFDLLRFDLIIDDQLRVHLMEANMSPNLSSAHFKPNSLLYEQILYSALQLVGIGSPIKHDSLETKNVDVDKMITADKNLATDLNKCATYDCDMSCNKPQCDLCLPCLRGSEYNVLQQAHREHLHRADMKRVFPKPIVNFIEYELEVEVKNLSARNAWMTRWFYAKCKYDTSWCN